MERNVKAFILASLAWLLLGAILGVGMTLQLGNFALLRFAHLHMLLLGFMAMMVYGVGYFILPRFNGVTLKWPRLVSLHFWVANLGLLGLAFGALEFRPLFAGISLLGILLFVTNMAVTLVGAPALESRLAEKTTGRSGTAPAAHATTSAGTASPIPAKPEQPVISGGETIGELLAAHPHLEETIRLFFGDGCFSCPGQTTETLMQAAAMHNIDPDLLLAELRRRA